VISYLQENSCLAVLFMLVGNSLFIRINKADLLVTTFFFFY